MVLPQPDSPDDAQGLALPQIKAHSIDRSHHPPTGKDMGVEVMHFQDNITNLSRHAAPLLVMSDEG